MAYDREAFKLRGENAKLNFPEHYAGKQQVDFQREDPKGLIAQSSNMESQSNNNVNDMDDDSGNGSGQITGIDIDIDIERDMPMGGSGTGECVSSETSELVWGEMGDAWFNAIPAGWGPGSPVWDDLDTSNNLILPSNFSFGSTHEQGFQDSDPQMQQDNLSFSSQGTSSTINPFFRKDEN